MTREGKWPLAALVAAVLATALLVACGGSDSNSDSSTTTATESATTARDSGGGDQEPRPEDKASGQGSEGQDQGSQGDGKQAGSGSSSPKDVATPLRVSGGGSEQFRVKGGDNSIQEYGEESDEAELQEVAEIVHGFFVARAEEKWDTACSYLARSNVEQLEQLASQSSEFKGAGCGPILKAFTRPLPASIQREITTVDAASFRDDGEQGFLIYYGADRTPSAMPLRSEDGTWKVAALSGTTLG